MPATPSLLPPNATPLERAIEAATATRVEGIDIGEATRLWDAATCPLPVLPWFAWGLSVDQWDASWSEAVKRDAVARSIDLHRRKGTPASVAAVLARFDALLTAVEWHQATPRGVPHTFDIVLPMVTAPGIAPGGERASVAFVEAIVREVTKVKPLREHMRLVQQIALQASVALIAAARVAFFQRHDATLVVDTSPDWDAWLQTEDGEPIEDGAGGFLDPRP